jgi:hypothetical protein
VTHSRTLPTVGVILAAVACSLALVALVDARDDDTGPTEHSNRPRLGESMNTLARRFGSLWFAMQYENRPLCEYELHEIHEVVEEITATPRIENGADISPLLAEVDSSKLGAVRAAIGDGDFEAARRAYRATIDACNSCHVMTGHGFIRIKTPTAPPLPNRDWRPAPPR